MLNSNFPFLFSIGNVVVVVVVDSVVVGAVVRVLYFPFCTSSWGGLIEL